MKTFNVQFKSMRLLLLTVVACGLTAGAVAAQEAPAPTAETEETATAYLIPVTGEVNNRMARRVRAGLEEAEAAGAQVAIIQIDTFGGQLEAAVAIRDALLDAPLRTLAFINKRAISAGALVALATHEIVMAPGATIGAATPQRLTWTGPEPAGEKVLSYFRKEMKAAAESRGHPGALAEAMVDPDVEVPGVVEKGKLLTLTTAEALELKLAAAESKDLEHLLATHKLELAAESPTEVAGAATDGGAGEWFRFQPWQVWLIAGVALAAGEIIMPGFFILWFAVGALLASLLAYLGAAWGVQMGAFLTSSSLLLVFSRTIFKSVLFRSQEGFSTNVEALKGRTGVVLKAIEGSLKPGRAKIGGEEWSAICEDDTRIAKGTKVEVLEIVGNKIKVKAV